MIDVCMLAVTKGGSPGRGRGSRSGPRTLFVGKQSWFSFLIDDLVSWIDSEKSRVELLKS